MRKPKVLIVEDDRRIARFLEIELEHSGYEVRKAETGYDALETFEEFMPDVVLLDVMLPELDGHEVAEKLRSIKPDVGIIMVSALGETKDKVEGLKKGADDYIVKPFETEELIARIEALLRRKGIQIQSVYEYEGIRVYPASMKVEVDGKEIHLSKTEYELLELLIKNAEVVLSKDKILDAIWGYDFAPNVVEVYINYLRKKLGEKGNLIKTVRGVGYVLRK